MKFLKYTFGLLVASAALSSCKKDVLDRPPLTKVVDTEFWRDETDLRAFGYGFYSNYFTGYNTGFSVDYTPVRGYTFSDDLTGKNAQANFETDIPSSRGSSSESAAWMSQYAGPTWNFSWVRKANIFLNRIETVTKPNISTEAYNHWTAVARFFRAFEYYRLVSVFGDVPYFDNVIADTDLATLYKDRDKRTFVMDKVYDDLKYAMANMRENDGANILNRYVAAAFVSRIMLYEGTYEHYHNIDASRAKKYLEFATEASEYVMNSNKWNFTKDFKSIFTSDNLSGHTEVLMYRIYDAAQNVTHAIGSYSNGTETVGVDPNLVLVKSFIATDGKVWQNSSVANAGSFAISDLIKTRDPRFEATFYDKPLVASATTLYGYKFASREALTFIGKAYPPAWGSNTNTSDAPVMRLAEVVLNWIEAKAVLAQYFGGAAISQSDLDKSINAIRNRPLEAAAIAKGVVKTAPITLASLPNDPTRDVDVPALIWEIRRERRMEFVFEYSRLLDLKRWKKLSNMNFSSNQDYFLGPWVNIPVEMPTYLTSTMVNRARVKKADGTVVTYNGSNAAAMVGYFMVENATNRNAFSDRSYLAPVGQSQIIQYQDRGYKLTQTTGW
ncbi:RagB/SusD family nutrient uptake outer membrane protein [Pedobacter ureilyticus]|uniref:RagB/SusD family nutrient uptake outer membrane protein n=1 Tax=Pedobacter ureilyticus TaxID=1393051 RepID=A0ABW9J3F7_9SPHI|nr:RagB/SusD family nutrient uptake outer membrane protein [Pedobacter helvus]